jgi:hypothetical protein
MDPGATSRGVVFGVYAAVVYDIISATNSSPQTTEINATARAETLMKWVHVGLGQAAIFVLIGALLERSSGRDWWPPILGGGLAGGMLYAQYVHAKNSGLENAHEPGTETYGQG